MHWVVVAARSADGPTILFLVRPDECVPAAPPDQLDVNCETLGPGTRLPLDFTAPTTGAGSNGSFLFLADLTSTQIVGRLDVVTSNALAVNACVSSNDRRRRPWA